MTEQGEPTERQRKILDINQANSDILQRLAVFGVDIDPTGKRGEMLYEKLVEWGIITKDQLEEFDLAWVEYFNGYLMKLEVDLRAQAKRAEEERRAAQFGVAKPSGIVVPGHNGRKNGNGRRGRG